MEEKRSRLKRNIRTLWSALGTHLPPIAFTGDPDSYVAHLRLWPCSTHELRQIQHEVSSVARLQLCTPLPIEQQLSRHGQVLHSDLQMAVGASHKPEDIVSTVQVISQVQARVLGLGGGSGGGR